MADTLNSESSKVKVDVNSFTAVTKNTRVELQKKVQALFQNLRTVLKVLMKTQKAKSRSHLKWLQRLGHGHMSIKTGFFFLV